MKAKQKTTVQLAIDSLNRAIVVHRARKNFIVKHKAKLLKFGVIPSGYGIYVDLDNLPHAQIMQAVKEFPGVWKKNSNGSRVDYVRNMEDGVSLRCWCGEPPPSCWIVETLVSVPAQPATTRIERTIVCKKETLAP